MLDFHTHILPEMDDGARNVSQSFAMLQMEQDQGVSLLVATPHFYAHEEDPVTFLQRRKACMDQLQSFLNESDAQLPEILPGAEILYYPGMSVSESLSCLKIGNSSLLLVEMPLTDWTEYMLEEVVQAGQICGCIPVLAHVDRYMRLLRNPNLLKVAAKYQLLSQVNASFFLYENTAGQALDALGQGLIHFIGSDCHNCTSRPPNVGFAEQVIARSGYMPQLRTITQQACSYLRITDCAF